jgi:hypothetical protein
MVIAINTNRWLTLPTGMLSQAVSRVSRNSDQEVKTLTKEIGLSLVGDLNQEERVRLRRTQRIR